MRQSIKAEHLTDERGNPAGGQTILILDDSEPNFGIIIPWQNGPLLKDCCNRENGQGTHAPGCRGVKERLKPNGAFVEGLLAACKDRIEFYQLSKFACLENAEAIACIEAALVALASRTKKRTDQGVEGTHAVHTS